MFLVARLRDAGVVVHEIRVLGAIPAKKNNIRATVRGGYYGGGVDREIAGIVAQLKGQRQGRGAIERPVHIGMEFFVRHHRADGDGMETTLLDALKASGWIKDDNTGRVRAVSWEARKVGPDQDTGACVMIVEVVG